MDYKTSQIILFDGECNLCNAFVQFIIKRDPEAKFKFASIQSESGKSLLIKCGGATNDFDSLVYIKGNTCFLKSSAGIKILIDLGGIWQLFNVFVIIPKFIRDFLYNLIAKSRYKLFGKRDTCMIPTPDIRKRFLD